MLTINVSGWRKGYGPYSLNLPFDEGRTDYEVRFKDGSIYTQESPFATEERDWNNDGDVYPRQGAWFRDRDGRGEFLAPVDMLRLVIDEEAEIPGLLDPLAAVKGYIKAKEEAENARKMAEAKAHPVPCRIGGRTVAVPFDTTRLDYEIELASGRCWRQVGYLNETYFLPDKTRVDPPVYGAWFRDSNDETRFFTADEMVELVASGHARVEGIHVPPRDERSPEPPKRGRSRSADIEL